jgi:HK97 family phage prohead protease
MTPTTTRAGARNSAEDAAHIQDGRGHVASARDHLDSADEHFSALGVPDADGSDSATTPGSDGSGSRTRAYGEWLELRGLSGSKVALSGEVLRYAPWYDVHDKWGKMSEQMLAFAATPALPVSDPVFLEDHVGPGLARVSNQTMELEDRASGLLVGVILDMDDPLQRSLATRVENGTISKMSVGFICGEDRWNEAGDQRSIISLAQIIDCSAVHSPASPTTHLSIAQQRASDAERARAEAELISLRNSLSFHPEQESRSRMKPTATDAERAKLAAEIAKLRAHRIEAQDNAAGRKRTDSRVAYYRALAESRKIEYRGAR